MGYAVYDDKNNRDRFAGYGVPAVCDFPPCNKKINRGLAYSCGDGNFTEYCGLHFCEDHLRSAPEGGYPSDDEYDEEEVDVEYIQMCERCAYGDPPFEPKPDLYEWTTHLLTDESWEQWRQENPVLVQQKIQDLKDLVM